MTERVLRLVDWLVRTGAPPSLRGMLDAELDASKRDRKDAKAATWRRVEDELPELEVDVLTCCFNPEFHNQRRYVFVNHLDHHPSHWAKGHRVTHWMPLPEPPNA